MEIDISLDSLDIEKKYLAEGFIGNGLYRVVIVRPKGTVGGTLEEISRRGANRARVSMERSLVAEEIPSNRNTRAAILCLIEDNGTLRKTDIEHGRYDIYYFEITRQNMKQHLKRVSIQQ